MTLFFGSSQDNKISHGRILDAVERCTEAIGICNTNIAIIQETLKSGSKTNDAIQNQVSANTIRLTTLEQRVNGSSAVGAFARAWVLPIALAFFGVAGFFAVGLMWLGDRLDGDSHTPAQQSRGQQ
jgi:hypothetical protein